jgi:hypothetical protein
MAPKSEKTQTKEDIATEYENLNLNALIDSIEKGTKVLNEDIQRLLVGFSVKVVTAKKPIEIAWFATELLKKIGHGVVKTRRIKWWLSKYAPLSYKEKDSKFIVNDNLYSMQNEFKDRISYVNNRLKVKWSGDDFREGRPSEPKVFNLDDELEKLLKKAEKFKNTDSAVVIQADNLNRLDRMFTRSEIVLKRLTEFREAIKARREAIRAKPSNDAVEEGIAIASGNEYSLGRTPDQVAATA